MPMLSINNCPKCNSTGRLDQLGGYYWVQCMNADCNHTGPKVEVPAKASQAVELWNKESENGTKPTI